MPSWAIPLTLTGFLLAAGLALAWRRAEARASARAEELGHLEASHAELAADLGREQKARRRQADELAEHRKRADKARKRSAKTPSQPLGTTARIQDLERELARSERESGRLREERDELAADLERARSARSVAAEPSPPPAARPEPSELEASLEEHRTRIRTLEQELEQAKQTEARMRKRMQTQEQLYAALRGELEAKKDRLRTQEEQLQRLQALKVAVLD